MAVDPPPGPAVGDADPRARALRVMERCQALRPFSEEPDRLTRPYGTPSLRSAQDAVAGWMTDAGLSTRRDAIGNLIGRRDGPDPHAGTLLLGSHLDSVRDGGNYDGPLGVLVALAAVEGLAATGARPTFAIELPAFADEEGLRFGTAYLGSSAYTGALDPALLATPDAAGIPLADAVRAFGGDPDAIRAEHPADGRLLGYVEVHIEQGPTLEAMDLPVGIVTAIAGRNRIDVAFAGESGHAGTVAMDRRRDALAAAAEFVLAAEEIGRGTDHLVATVGQIAVEPGAANVIAGHARLVVDLRHPNDAVRHDAHRRLRQRAEAIAERRRVALSWEVPNDNGAVVMDPTLANLLARAVEDIGFPVHRLPSGAGHDPVMLAPHGPVAMLFVRCAGGVSHNPAESVTTDDVATAIAVLDRFLRLVAVP